MPNPSLMSEIIARRTSTILLGIVEKKKERKL
jgi:hypothetical protein